MITVFTTLLARLDHSELGQLAEDLERIARAARRRAGELADQERHRRAAEDRRDQLDRAAEMVGCLVYDGLDYERALDQVHRQSGIEIDDLRHAFRQFVKSQTHHARIYRRAMVGRLAARGWTNRRIADELEVHPNTVSRIIGELYRRAR